MRCASGMRSSEAVGTSSARRSRARLVTCQGILDLVFEVCKQRLASVASRNSRRFASSPTLGTPPVPEIGVASLGSFSLWKWPSMSRLQEGKLKVSDADCDGQSAVRLTRWF